MRGKAARQPQVASELSSCKHPGFTHHQRQGTIVGMRPSLIPIAFGELIGIALQIPPRADPYGTGVRRQLPVARDPFITIVAPGPIPRQPDVLGRRLRQRHLCLKRRRGHGYNRRADGGSGRYQHIAWVAGDDHRRCVWGGGGSGGNRADRRWRRRCRNHMRLGLGRAASQQAECATRDQGGGEPRQWVERG